ncbi:MAG: hypothetical protein HQL15_06380 [Candidatus Omnitrophica bacterium]|nr:hypothetical protein [Candidatus Omnitrophota bacterium]
MNPYITNTESEVKEMLSVMGVSSIDELFADIKPQHRPKSFDLPSGLSEYEVMCHLTKLSLKNNVHLKPFIGGGFYDHYVPAATLLKYPEIKDLVNPT